MKQTMTFCAVQMTSTASLESNLNYIEQQLEQQDMSAVQCVVLPEMFALFGVRDQGELGKQEQDFHGPVGEAVRRWSQQFGVWIVAGTIPVCTADSELPRARCHVTDDNGDVVAIYDKIHLFDAAVNDRQGAYRESDSYSAGNEVVTVQTPWGRMGLAVCYDLRFPELFRALNDAGADFVVLPSAFTAHTGEAHWEVLCRARAIENACGFVGVNQCGEHDSKRSTWGHSLAVDAWGRTEMMDGQAGCRLFTLDLSVNATVREQIPVNDNRRLKV